MARRLPDPEGSEDTPILSKLADCPPEWRGWVLQRFQELNALRPLRFRRRALRLAGLVRVVKQGLVGNSAWGRSMLGKLGRKWSGKRGGRGGMMGGSEVRRQPRDRHADRRF
jgi:hypothetical protein